MRDAWKNVDLAVRNNLVIDTGLHSFLEPEIPSSDERTKFIRKSLRTLKTRRMLLRAQWYTEIADGLEKIRKGRVALQIVFLMSLAEGVSKLRTGRLKSGSQNSVIDFFSFTSEEDKKFLLKNFNHNLDVRRPRLRFKSAIKILYDVRSSAIHGEDFYSFFLSDEKSKTEHISTLTMAKMGPSGKKRSVTLDVNLTYGELRDIVRRTALENIKVCF